MTKPKRPLPSLRFVILKGTTVLYRLIPQTTPKGYVIPDRWAIPGCRIEHTTQLQERCRRNGWSYRIEGSPK